MGRSASPVHHSGNDRSNERRSVVQPATRRSVTCPAVLGIVVALVSYTTSPDTNPYLPQVMLTGLGEAEPTAARRFRFSSRAAAHTRRRRAKQASPRRRGARAWALS